MSQEAERVYTINLGKALLSPNNQRSKRAINMIREFATRHMKTEQVKIDQDLSQSIWKRGIRRPPRKIRVKMAKTEEGFVLVSTYEEEKPKEVIEEKPKAKPKEAATPEQELEEQIEEQIEAKPEEKEEEEIKEEILQPAEEKPKETKQQEKKPKPKETKSKKEETKKEAQKKEAKKSEKRKSAKKEKSK